MNRTCNENGSLIYCGGTRCSSDDEMSCCVHLRRKQQPTDKNDGEEQSRRANVFLILWCFQHLNYYCGGTRH